MKNIISQFLRNRRNRRWAAQSQLAAEEIDAGGHFCCIALCHQCRPDPQRLVDIFTKLFRPTPEELAADGWSEQCIIWFGHWLHDQNQQDRVFALLLLAEIIANDDY